MRLSIVIATFNRAGGLIRTLRSVLLNVELPAEDWEVVVVDNNCTDNTRELFAEFRAKNKRFNLHIVREPEQGLSHARNRGIREAQGDIIAIIDDDQEVLPDYGRAYLDLFDRRSAAAAAGGRITPLYEFRPPRWLSRWTERPIAGTLSLGSRARIFPVGKFPGGGNMAVRREVFERIGAFDPLLGRTGTKLLAGEEKDFFARLRASDEGEIWWVPRAEILHIIPRERLTLSYLARVSRMVGVSERVRTHRGFARLMQELAKWVATIIIGLYYIVTLRPAKTWALAVLRWNVTRGLITNN